MIEESSLGSKYNLFRLLKLNRKRNGEEDKSWNEGMSVNEKHHVADKRFKYWELRKNKKM